ncbi:MAG: restriction endonuclease, partial [Bacteriovoracaceae bacterium]|nr:restriction endonuclease [Bacteriovoracaceae bacterium]
MKFAYEDLHHKQFEELVVLICRKLFGISVQNFSDGADGGRDSRFSGTAENYPSKASPWNGKTVIQAKHTNGYNKS